MLSLFHGLNIYFVEFCDVMKFNFSICDSITSTEEEPLTVYLH
jgi:hypothetical protein